MKYSEIKKEVKEVERSLEDARKYRRSLESTVGVEEEEIEKVQKKLPLLLQAEKDKQLKQHMEAGLAPFHEKVGKLSGKLQMLKEEKTAKVSGISLEEIERQMASADKLTNQIKAITESVEDKLQNNLGDRILGHVKASLEKQNLAGSEADIQKSFKKLKKLNKRIRLDVKRESKKSFVGTFDAVWDKMMSSNKTNVMLFYVGLLALFIAFAGVVAPVFFGLIGLVCAKALKTNYLYYQALIECVKLTQNYDKLAEFRKQQAQAVFQKKQKEVTGEYDKRIAGMEKQLEKVNGEINARTLELQKGFQFDDAEVERQIKAQVEVRKAAISESNGKLQANAEEIQRLEARMKELQNALGDSLSLLKEEYLNPSRLGTDSECVGDVLLDFKDDTPVFFQFKKASSYFVYKDTKDLINFIRLFITQIRARMDSDVYTIDLWDSKMFGSGCMDMTTQDMPLLGMLVTEDEIKEDLVMKTQILMKRIGKVKRSYNDIFEYNNYLLSIDSLVEPYSFVFCVDQNSSLFSSDAAQALLGESSHAAGVFVLYFISDEELRKNEKMVELIDYFDYGYLIEHGEIFSKSRAFIKKMYLGA